MNHHLGVLFRTISHNLLILERSRRRRKREETFVKLQSLKTSFIIGTEFGAGMKLDVRDRGQLQRFQQFRDSRTHIGAIHANSNAGDDEDEG